MEHDSILEERLRKANERVDDNLPNLWKQAELNLKLLEEEYHKKQGEKSS